MLECDRIDVSEGIDINKTNASKECDICHYQYFKEIGFKYEPCLCNSYHDLIEKATSFNDVAVVYVKRSAYRIRFWYKRKNDAISIIKNFNLNNKKGFLKYFLNEFFVPYGSSLETNILLTSILSIFVTHFYNRSKKKNNFFDSSLGVQGVIVCFYNSSKQVGVFLDFKG